MAFNPRSHELEVELELEHFGFLRLDAIFDKEERPVLRRYVYVSTRVQENEKTRTTRLTAQQNHTRAERMDWS
jgi:hypothetical protein